MVTSKSTRVIERRGPTASFPNRFGDPAAHLHGLRGRGADPKSPELRPVSAPPAPVGGMLGTGSMSTTTGAGVGKRQVFYRYQNEGGRIVIVDSEAQVPAQLRSTVQRIELDGTPENPAPSRPLPTHEGPALFHAPSFLLGVGAALLLTTLLFSFRGGGARTLTKLAGGAALAAILAGAYFGWLRRSTGQSDSLIGTPTELVDDARRAVEKVEQRREKQQQVLDEIEREAK